MQQREKTSWDVLVSNFMFGWSFLQFYQILLIHISVGDFTPDFILDMIGMIDI